MQQYIPYLFLANILLIIADAALGYHVAPLMLGKMDDANVDSMTRTAGSIRKLLSVVVAFYMFFNCLAYFRGNNILMLIVTGIVVFDIGFQLIVRRKLGRGPDSG